jgi:hypothetical protein
MPVGLVVLPENRHLDSGRDQLGGDGCPDVAGAAGDQGSHWNRPVTGVGQM